MTETIGFAPEEIRLDESTRSAPLKWVIAVDSALARGLQVNAAVCVSAATQSAVHGLLGPDAADASGAAHPGLPWAGCSVLGASVGELTSLAAAAEERGAFVSIMPSAAQATRVYSEYLAAVAESATEDLAPIAVSIVGPRRVVDKLVRKLELLS
jgi:hypothetical protein